ncbi:hypothetical protein V6N13_049893 [Hibiscus sabdariffa]|uniref:Uncharacterized protein n=1 Tax=Hibiscus sabdariffa TaxID=183260 RepID=A0ABR2QVS7_9ROSI
MRSTTPFGISPENWLFEKSILVKTFHFPMSIGSAPLREFEDKFRISRSLSPVRVEGIVEENILDPRNSFLKEVRLPKQAGIGPDNLLLVKFK